MIAPMTTNRATNRPHTATPATIDQSRCVPLFHYHERQPDPSVIIAECPACHLRTDPATDRHDAMGQWNDLHATARHEYATADRGQS